MKVKLKDLLFLISIFILPVTGAAWGLNYETSFKNEVIETALAGNQYAAEILHTHNKKFSSLNHKIVRSAMEGNSCALIVLGIKEKEEEE